MDSRTLQRLLPRDEQAAASALGPRHPLVRLLGSRRTLVEQQLVTCIPLLFGLAGTLMGVETAPLVLAASLAVAIALVGGLVVVHAHIRRAVQELIATGGDGSPIEVVARERRRLMSRRERERLARSLELFLRDAEDWPALHPRARPFLDVRCLRFGAGEARAVIARLRDDAPRARGVARAARLLTDGCSPLFGGDAQKLRRELVQIADDLGRSPHRRRATKDWPNP